MQRYLSFIVIAFTFLGCAKDHVPAENPTVDKSAFLASLMVNDRFWRFEELVIEQGNSSTTIDLKIAEPPIPYELITGPVANLSFKFQGQSLFYGTITTGPFGNIPYSQDKTMSTFEQENSDMGRWQWDDEKQTVALDFDGPFEDIIGAVSKNGFKPDMGYLDNKYPAAYKTLQEAINGGAPERIRIVAFEEDPQLGQIKYTFIMRGAWATKFLYGGARTRYYEALY